MSGLVLLAAGGTGGHMFPAEALAGQLLSRGYRVGLVTDRRGAGFGERLPAVEVHRISAGGLAGRGLASRLIALLHLIKGFFEARRIVARLRPLIAVGFGGYASVPTVLAAARAGLPTLLHEQNAVLGRANRLLARRARAIATSFADTQALGGATPRFTGNPVRPAIAALAARAYAAPMESFGLLVLGGSQGAHVFSQLVPAAIALLPAELRQRLAVAQQCRAEDLEAARAAYDALAQPVELSTFFADVPERLGRAHLVVCRSGASTVAELAAAGRPAILLPFPHATDDHQTANARSFAAAGGGWLLPEAEATPAKLAEMLTGLIAQPSALVFAANRAHRAGKPDAAQRLADLVGELARAKEAA
jgi:UDP-N-acetylglucosamine--N-acetylmuramyl-(pentapeptide) pyrophosphoryl-undecaprenol N-acetylglucosamine transferase